MNASAFKIVLIKEIVLCSFFVTFCCYIESIKDRLLTEHSVEILISRFANINLPPPVDHIHLCLFKDNGPKPKNENYIFRSACKWGPVQPRRQILICNNLVGGTIWVGDTKESKLCLQSTAQLSRGA